MNVLKEKIIHALGGYTLHDKVDAQWKNYDKGAKNGYTQGLKAALEVVSRCALQNKEKYEKAETDANAVAS